MEHRDEREPCFVISVVSRMVSMHPQTLRKYERLGLIAPSRSGGRFRLFSAEDVARLRRIQELQDAGRLLLAGPHPAVDSDNPGPAGFTGSLIVAEFDNLQAAQQWADADPYIDAGVYSKVTVKPFKKVFPQ